MAAPAWRSAFIRADCDVRALVAEAGVTEAWSAESGKLGPVPALIALESVDGGRGLVAELDALDAAMPAPVTSTEALAPDELAYILYTSGSTGKRRA